MGGHLKERMSHITDPKQWNMNIVVREWNQISPEYEFRAFVYKKRMTALTHYYKFLYVHGTLQIFCLRYSIYQICDPN